MKLLAVETMNYIKSTIFLCFRNVFQRYSLYFHKSPKLLETHATVFSYFKHFLNLIHLYLRQIELKVLENVVIFKYYPTETENKQHTKISCQIGT